MPHDSPIRPRRVRSHPLLRDMLASTRLSPTDFTAPLFIRSGTHQKIPVPSMPGVFQFSPDAALTQLKKLQSLGLTSYLLFGVTDPEKKDHLGSHAHNPHNEVCTTLKLAKDAGINMLAITDLCYCEYTNHGHCGPLTPNSQPSSPASQTSALKTQDYIIDNDLTIQRLGEQAVLHARAGADIVAPSGMMDNMVHAIRSALDADQKPDTLILSYAVKYASAFYGPFRQAAHSSLPLAPSPLNSQPSGFSNPPVPQSIEGVPDPSIPTDRKSHQMDFRRDSTAHGATPKEALHEARLDIAQGADLLMVKPALPYLDILSHLTAALEVPISAYQVSGEYAMLKSAAANGALEEKPAVLETMHALKRAGAAVILTYYAEQLAQWLQ